ncbi:MAG TPA: NAD(P)/FAD-dependent oxidoreductase [Geobacteraceae bacterium]
MNDITYDAIIVGSGPAGVAAAIHLARRGLTVCLLEKESHPRYKACGGGVTARAAALLPAAFKAAVEDPCRRVELRFWGKKQCFVARRDRPIIYMVMRTELDALLLAEARRLGVEVLENTAAEDILEEDGRVSILTARGAKTGRFVIAADGATSLVARKSGWPDNHSAIPALECEVATDPATLDRFRGCARFDLEHPRKGYSWVFPKKDHLSVGVLSMARGAAGLKDSLHTYLDSLGIRPVSPLEPRGALIPVKPRPGPHVRGRVLLAGDAAGLAEPICAEGISNALISGALAARAIAEGAPDPARVATIYVRELRASVLRELEIAARHARLLYDHPRLQGIMFQLKGKAVCEKLTDIIMGEKSLSSIGGPFGQLFGS